MPEADDSAFTTDRAKFIIWHAGGEGKFLQRYLLVP